MKISVAPRAERDLERQLQFLVDKYASRAARNLERRMAWFIENTLASHPRIGHPIEHRDVWETWIPGTRLVLWYRFTEAELQIVRIWHSAQDRDAQ